MAHAHPSEQVAYGNLVFGGLLALGGVFGYLRTRSVPSLVAGASLGAAAAYGGYALLQNDATGYYVAVGTNVLVFAVMGMRFARTRKIMPAGMLTLASAGVGALTAREFMQQTH